MRRRWGWSWRPFAALLGLLVCPALFVEVHAAATKAKSTKSRKQKEGRAMNETSEKTARALKLPDAAYYGSSDDPFNKVAATLAPPDVPARPITAGAVGLGLEPVFALGAPSAVALEHGADLPAVVVLRHSGARNWEAKLAPNLHVVLVDFGSGALKWVNPLLLDEPEFDPSRSGPPPSDITRRASLHGATRFHIPALFGEKWPASSYAVTAIYYDWLSNTVTVAGHPPAGQGPPPTRSPSPFLEAAPRETASALGAGLRLRLPEAPGPAGTLPIAGSISSTIDTIKVARLSGEPARSAIIATLVLVALDSDRLRTIELVVPAELQGDVATGTFAFDLAARPELAGLTGELRVFLASGPTIVAAGALTIPTRPREGAPG